MKPEERNRERNRQEKKRESADGSIPDPVKPQMRVTRFNLILSMMRSFNRRTGSVRSPMRILAAGIILALLVIHSVGAKREETMDETLSLSLSLSLAEERRPHAVHKNQRNKRHTNTRERQESQGKRSSRKTAHLLHTY
jgi:hypothetical protein